MRLAIAVLLAAVVAVSGCTEDLVTQQDLNDQTSELKQHTEEQLEKDNNLVRQYSIGEIDFQGICGNESSKSYLGQSRIYERDHSIQEFREGSYLVRNGVDVRDIDVPWCGHDMSLEQLHLDSVTYNKSVYQNGSEISSASDTCRGWETDYGEVDVRGESRAEIEEELVGVAKMIYGECLGIPGDEWGPLWGDVDQ